MEIAYEVLVIGHGYLSLYCSHMTPSTNGDALASRTRKTSLMDNAGQSITVSTRMSYEYSTERGSHVLITSTSYAITIAVLHDTCTLIGIGCVDTVSLLGLLYHANGVLASVCYHRIP